MNKSKEIILNWLFCYAKDNGWVIKHFPFKKQYSLEDLGKQNCLFVFQEDSINNNKYFIQTINFIIDVILKHKTPKTKKIDSLLQFAVSHGFKIKHISENGVFFNYECEDGFEQEEIFLPLNERDEDFEVKVVKFLSHIVS